jgi:hypothetical protein
MEGNIFETFVVFYIVTMGKVLINVSNNIAVRLTL